MQTIFIKLLVIIAISTSLSFTSTAASEEITMPLPELEQLYFNTLGDLEGDERLPFPTLFIYDHESKKILSKAQMITSLGSKTPLGFVRHDVIERVVENEFLSGLNKRGLGKVRYSVIYFIVAPWVLKDPEMNNKNQKIEQLFDGNTDYNFIKLYMGGP